MVAVHVEQARPRIYPARKAAWLDEKISTSARSVQLFPVSRSSKSAQRRLSTVEKEGIITVGVLKVARSAMERFAMHTHQRCRRWDSSSRGQIFHPGAMGLATSRTRAQRL